MIQWTEVSSSRLIGKDNAIWQRRFSGCALPVFATLASLAGIVALGISILTKNPFAVTTYFGVVFISVSGLIFTTVFEPKPKGGNDRTYEIDFTNQQLKISSHDIKVHLRHINQIRVFKQLMRNTKMQRSEYLAFFVLHDGSHLWLDTDTNREDVFASANVLANKLGIRVVDCTHNESIKTIPLDDPIQPLNESILQSDTSAVTPSLFASNISSEGLWITQQKNNSMLLKLKKFFVCMIMLSIFGFVITILQDSTSIFMTIVFILVFGAIGAIFSIGFIVSEKRLAVLCRTTCIDIYDGKSIKHSLVKSDVVGVQVHYFQDFLTLTLQTKTEHPKFISLFVQREQRLALDYWQTPNKIYPIWNNMLSQAGYDEYIKLASQILSA